MAYFTVDIPPGVYANGTPYQAAGRYNGANLWRWFSGESRPVGGWVERSTTTLSGKARAILTWRDNSNNSWAGIGTHTNLYVMTKSGDVSDITPVVYVPGRPDAITGGGYGSGTYGSGTYGASVPSSDVIDATVWTLDTWGENLVGCTPDDQRIYEWVPDTAFPAVQITGSPLARAVVVTEERIMMALGADGNPRLVRNSDQQDNTTWTPTTTNYARDFTLQTVGRLMCGKKVNGGTLLMTDVDAWLATFLGFPLVYGYNKVGSGCGIISQQAIAVTESQAVWMSQNGFWIYNGYTQPLDCEVHDYVFSDLNFDQASKIYAVHVSAFGEVWWFYPSSESIEIDRYLIWNYRENHWSLGQVVRLCGTDKGVFNYPLMVDNGGQVWDHENGFDHDGINPLATTGPIQIGNGDQIIHVRKIVPDERSLGQVTVSFATKFYPMGSNTSYGPYSLTENTDARFTARQVQLTYTGEDGEDFRVGNFRIEGVPGGLR
jgi:hypothetical protein